MAAGYSLEHFYYGQFVRQGKPEGDMILLAWSGGIKQEDVPELVRSAPLPPASLSTGSWGLVHGSTTPFLFVQSQQNDAGGAMLHIAVMPVDALRALGGNVQVIAGLVERAMPVYDRLGDRLRPITLPDAAPPSEDQQVDAMLAMMSCAQNQLTVVESLLSAIVQGVQVVIVNAPPDPVQRLALVEGLLALMPPPARFGVTFALHTVPATRVDAQIRYTTKADAPPEALVFDWAKARVSGNQVEDAYSSFIVSQLRLDTSLVLEQTSALTPVASWRIKRGDTLAQALGYASHRLLIDNALLSNVPIPAEDAARILTEDPTLSDDLKALYARHVLAFALALGETSHAEPIALMVREQSGLEQSVLQQLIDAAHSGRAGAVYALLSSWLANPLGPREIEWSRLLQGAALTHVGGLLQAGDTEGIQAFLDDMLKSPLRVEMETATTRIIDLALPLMKRSPYLARTLFLLAADTLPADKFQTIVMDSSLLMQMPDAVSRLTQYYNRTDSGGVPAGLLARAVAAFSDEWSTLVLIRLTEIALLTDRLELVDTPALAGLARAALSPQADAYDNVFRWVVRNLSIDETLTSLDEAAQRSLLQILLARQAYPELTYELLRHSRVLYAADKQADFAVMVRRLFIEAPLSPEAVSNALRILDAGGVKPLPLAMAHLGALKRNEWSEALQPVASNVTTILFNNRAVVEGVPASAMLELLDFHVQRRDITESIRVAGLFPMIAARKGENGATLMAQMYRLLDWDKQARIAALEILRRYVRLTDQSYAWQAVHRLSELLSPRLMPTLEATFALRLMMDGEDLTQYAMLVHLTAMFLNDTTMVYVDKKSAPGIKTLLGDLDSLVGGLTDADRTTLSNTMLDLGRVLEALVKQQRGSRPRELDAQVDQMVAGTLKPQSALDAFRLAGGYFSRGKRLRVKFAVMPSLHPFAQRAAPSLLFESQVTVRVLRNLLRAFPPEHEIPLSSEVIRAEIESLWGDLALEERRKLVRNLAIDLQMIPDLVTHIMDNGDPKVIEENNGAGKKLDTGKHRPENTLEFYRFVHGYFKARSRHK